MNDRKPERIRDVLLADRNEQRLGLGKPHRGGPLVEKRHQIRRAFQRRASPQAEEVLVQHPLLA